MQLLKPPREPPSFDINPESLLEQARRLVQQTRTIQDRLVSTITPEIATFTNTLRALADGYGHRLRESSILEFYQHVATDEKVRAASREAQQLLTDFSNESESRADIYNLVDAVYQKRENLDIESKRLIVKERRQFILNGLKIPSEQDRHRFREIKTLITHKCIEFRNNLSNWKESTWFTKEELQGLPEGLIQLFEQGTGVNANKFRVTVRHTYGILSLASCGDTRKRMFIVDANSRSQNASLLKSVVMLRHEAAQLLGYSNHVELRLEDSLQKSSNTIIKFLRDFRSSISKMGEFEVQSLLQFKEKDLKNRGEDFDGRFYLWDRWYYNERLKKHDFYIDDRKVAEYFPLGPTLSHMFEIFEDLFGLKFETMGTEMGRPTPNARSKSSVWHQDVLAYSVWSQEDLESQNSRLEFLGYMYLDLHPREGKNIRSNRSFLLQPGFNDSNGKRWHPSVALVCNFPGPTNSRPSLLTHSSVVMFFHELGHGIHDLVSRAQYARFHGANTVQGFPELPSQLLEYWCWTASTLRRISQHYSTISPEYEEAWKKEESKQGDEEVEKIVPTKIPDDMLENLIRTEKYNLALFYLSSLQISLFDLIIHGSTSHEELENMNTSYLYNMLAKEIVGIDGPESQKEGYEWGHLEANLPHLMGDSDAAYYNYISTKVLASDIFHSKFEADPMNDKEGRRYRRMILEKGGSMDEMEILVSYLGRSPNADAFYEELGVQDSRDS